MCTVSVIAVGQGFRVVCSRDELRSRAPASPPRTFTVDDDVAAAWPVDGTAGGSWIAANSAGVVLCLLNVNVPGASMPTPQTLLSRGVLIPKTARFTRAIDAAAAVETFPLHRFAPFRFLAIDRSKKGVRVHSVRWDRSTVQWGEATVPACFVSSGLGDELVQPRLDAFRDLVAASPSPDLQDAFHTHRWPDRPHLSVLMSRPDARTVSVTSVAVPAAASHAYAAGEVTVGAALMTYREVAE